ncbi:hypothetical protein NPIL_684641 [Nephila pilipes]|uniref:Uncharacterized protein n=1 Tax=Nephila pilipes TaxID=299642 RepID=A0A8X6T2C5_NEPPI|nr:hypothetical protein NPIL_684641 [Nephila pilipes]
MTYIDSTYFTYDFRTMRYLLTGVIRVLTHDTQYFESQLKLFSSESSTEPQSTRGEDFRAMKYQLSGVIRVLIRDIQVQLPAKSCRAG